MYFHGSPDEDLNTFAEKLGITPHLSDLGELSPEGRVLYLNNKIIKRIRITSDLHLGHSNSSIKNIDEFVSTLSGFDLVIFAGDTFEGRKGILFERGIAAINELLKSLKSQKIKALFLAGNHDPNSTNLRAVSLKNGEFVLTHGDAIFLSVAPWSREFLFNKKQIQSLISTNNENHPISQIDSRLDLAQCVSNAIMPIFPKPKKNKLLNFLHHCCWPPERPFRIVGSWMLMPHFCGQFAQLYFPNCKTFLCGHFHRKGNWKCGGIEIINTGAFFKLSKQQFIDLNL